MKTRVPCLFLGQIIQVAVADVEVEIIRKLGVSHGFLLGEAVVAVIKLFVNQFSLCYFT